jgi:hypothetical protein
MVIRTWVSFYVETIWVEISLYSLAEVRMPPPPKYIPQTRPPKYIPQTWPGSFHRLHRWAYLAQDFVCLD